MIPAKEFIHLITQLIRVLPLKKGIGIGPPLLGGRRETRATAFSPSSSTEEESGVTAAAATRGIVSHDWKAEQRSRGGTALVASEVVIVVQRQGNK